MKKMIKFVKGKKEDENNKVVVITESKRMSFDRGDERESREEDFLAADKSITKVHKAVWQENPDKLRTIIKTHDIDITDKLDRTALYFAVLKNNAVLVELLLEHRANQNIPDIDGVTPFLKSVQMGGRECALTLLRHGADVKRADKDLNSCLHFAVATGQADLLPLLLDQGIDCNAHNIFGERPLHLAARSGQLELASLLLSRGAGVNAADTRGGTPLMGAAVAGHSELVTLLLQHNADPAIRDSHGKTAADHASSGGFKELAAKLRNVAAAVLTPKPVPVDPGKNSDSDTWNDSPASTPSRRQADKQLARICEQLAHEETDVSVSVSESEPSVRRSENGSPQSGVIPPPCKPLRSLEYLQGAVDSSAAHPVHLLTLGTVRTRHVSMTESEHSKCATPHRYSYQGELKAAAGPSNATAPDLVAYCGLGEDRSAASNPVADAGSAIHSDWGSGDSLPLDEFSRSKESSFLQKQFSILEDYEKNHSRTCSVSHKEPAAAVEPQDCRLDDVADLLEERTTRRPCTRGHHAHERRLDDIADLLEDNNRINAQLERYAGQSDILLMANKSRSLPRSCHEPPAGSYRTGSMSLPRTLDCGKDLVRDMKRYGSFRPRAHLFSSGRSSRAKHPHHHHGFIDKLKHMFGKKSQAHQAEDGPKNNNNNNNNHEPVREPERKVTPLGSMNFEMGHSRKSSSSRSYSDRSNYELAKLDDEPRNEARMCVPKYEEELKRLLAEKSAGKKECRCSEATIKEEPDKWKKQFSFPCLLNRHIITTRAAKLSCV